MNTFFGYDKSTVEKSTGHSYIFFIADEVIGIPPLFIPFWPCREQGLFLYLKIYVHRWINQDKLPEQIEKTNICLEVKQSGRKAKT